MMNSSGNFPFRGPGGKIFLVGFMGSGKTYWGRKWSQQYYLDFFDLDDLIESDQKKSISAIFEKEGEDHFREIETNTLKTFSQKDNFMVACGGGAACFSNNMQWMNENGTTVYLSAKPQTIYDRVAAEKDKRPLLEKVDKAGLLSFIEQKLKEREPFYKQAKIILPVEELSDQSIPSFLIFNS
jgi:shikimate kinase